MLFATGRLVGWVAHAAEQYAAGEPIRPRATTSARALPNQAALKTLFEACRRLKPPDLVRLLQKGREAFGAGVKEAAVALI